MEPELARAFGRLEARRRELLDLAAAGGDASFNQRPREGGWSAAQVLEHLLLAESLSLVYVRKKMQAGAGLPRAGPSSALRLLALRAFLASPVRRKATAATASVPDRSSLDDLRTRWDETRDGWRRLLQDYPSELLGRLVFRHPAVGLLKLSQTLGFMQAHLDHHARQLRAALRAAQRSAAVNADLDAR